jgi:two-component system sensor histidine kinase KdpD
VTDPISPLRGAGSPTRQVIAALLPPVVATVIATELHPDGTGVPVSLYVVAVVVAAALGGRRSGLVAAVLAAVGFVFFFTDPRYTLRIDRQEQVVSSVLFVATALIVGGLFSRLVDSGARAARGERDARLLASLSTLLVSGEPLPSVLEDAATLLVDGVGVAGCTIEVEFAGETLASSAGSVSGPLVPFPIEQAGARLGRVSVAPDPLGSGLEADRRDVLKAAAAQVGVLVLRRRLDQQVRSAEMAVEANELRAALFSSVTHDLRTPLASILAGVTTLRSAGAVLDEDRRAELLDTVAAETERLDRLVGNILDLARVRADALKPERERLSADELLDAILTRMRPRLRGVKLHRVVRDDVPDVWADPVLLDQAITNVLDNAVEHAGSGGAVDVSVAGYRGGVEIRIADDGPGIPTAERERVFEAFYRGAGGVADPKRPGSGLGLAIARAIAMAHGGAVRAEGSPRGGAAIVFSLPVWNEGTGM